jgi:hypothetical protein
LSAISAQGLDPAGHHSGVLKEHRAVAEVMLVEGDALLGAVQKLRQEIFAFLDGCTSQVVAIKLDKIDYVLGMPGRKDSY